MDNIVKTEVILSEESVKRIIVAETGKALSQVPGMLETLIQETLFYREPKRNSYDKEKPTLYESVIKKTLQPMVEAELTSIAEKNRPKLAAIIKKAFKTGVVDNKEFEGRLISRLAKFTSNISFYVSDD